jgi:hypothetical protein
MTFVDNVAGLDLVDDLLVVFSQRATALVAFFNGGVKTGLFEVPLRNLQMLINVHWYLLG